MSDRPYWFECFFLGRDLRDWFGNHFRHLLCRDRRFFLRNRTYWFECSFLGRDLRDRLGNHFRHLLLSDWWDRFGDHFRHLLLSDWWDRFGDHFRHLLGDDRRFLVRDYLRRRLLREDLRCFPGDHLNGISLCRLFALGEGELGRRERLRAASIRNDQKRCNCYA